MTDIETLRAAMAAGTGYPFACYAWAQTPDTDAWGTVNIVTEAGAVWGDGQQIDQALTGQVHLFTRLPGAEVFQLAQTALRGMGFSWKLTAVQYEQDTRLIHYTWEWADWGDVP